MDPMTYIFPRMTKCTYFDFGSSGDVQKHDALCLLPLNIINEKIYIALWFWFLILAILTVLVIIYRLFAIGSENVRCKGLISRCKLSSERDIRLICHHCDVGDWFLFYMVAENLDPLIMREIVAAIASKISEHLELKKELKAQHEKEEAENEKLRLIMDEQYRQQLAKYSDSSGGSGNGGDTYSTTSTQRNTLVLVDQEPIVKKIKKRLYNKRLWSIDLGSGDVRQQLFGQARSSSYVNQEARNGGGSNRAHNVACDTPRTPLSNTFEFASAPPISEAPLSSAPLLSLHKRESLSRKASTSSSGVSSVGSSDAFVMEMSTISGSSPCLDELDTRQSASTRWRNVHHYHES